MAMYANAAGSCIQPRYQAPSSCFLSRTRSLRKAQCTSLVRWMISECAFFLCLVRPFSLQSALASFLLLLWVFSTAGLLRSFHCLCLLLRRGYGSDVRLVGNSQPCRSSRFLPRSLRASCIACVADVDSPGGSLTGCPCSAWLAGHSLVLGVRPFIRCISI